MAFDDRSLDDYIDVPQRIADFREHHPDGALHPADPAAPYHIVRVPNSWCRTCAGRGLLKVRQDWKKCPRCDGQGLRRAEEPQEDVFIVYAAAARRSPDDAHPGVGMAWESYPGQTPYTLGSELQNAETSAWGRAIVAALASDAKRGVSSREEVRNRVAEQEEPRQRFAHTDAEHERLVPGQSTEDRANGKKAERIKGQQAPDDEWTTTPPPIDPEWYHEIESEIQKFTSDDYGRVLWRRVNEKVEAGGCSKQDGEKLQTLIRARHRALAVEREPAEAVADAS